MGQIDHRRRDDEEPEAQFDGREWGSLGERGNLLAGEGWRYTPLGRTRHCTGRSGDVRASACGVIGQDPYWLGTGSQEEYERLASRPKCTRCERAVSHAEPDADDPGAGR